MTGQQLKNSILQMAVQGKLVPQDPNDEPASVLLERIRKEKEQLVKDGKIKKEKSSSYIFRGPDNLPYEKVGNNEPVCIADEVPFEIPDSWEWARLATLGEIIGGGTPKTNIPEYWDNGSIPWLTPADMKFVTGKYVAKGERCITEKGLKESSAHMMPAGSIVYSSRAPIGYIAITSAGLCTNQGFKSLVPTLMCIDDYIYYCLIAFTPEIQSRASGTTFKEISGTEFGKTLIPLPPLAEQKRIVKAIEKVLPHIKDYEEKHNQLSLIQSSFPEALKKSILQEAIQGKLVPQDPNDEPVSVLLERIREEKQRLIKEGKIKKDKHESIIFRRDNSYYEKRGSVEVCIDDEIPFELPVGWRWSRLGICLDVRDGTHDTPRYVSDGVPLITSKNLSNGQIDFSTAKLISKEDSEVINQRSKVDDGDIMYAMIGSIGNPVLYHGNDDFSIKNMALFKQIPNGMCMNFVYWFLILAQSDMKQQASGAVQSFVSLGYIRNYLIPIPPLAEQQRIARRLDSLFNNIDALRQQ